MVGVGPPGFEPESRGPEQLADTRLVVLGADLGAERLASGELDYVYARDRDLLGAAGDQMHLDPVRGAVVERPMVEPGRVEVRAQLVVQDPEAVAVEFRGDTRGVVVGRLDPRGVLP